MAVRYVASADAFVVHPETSDRRALTERLAKLGQAEELEGSDALLVRLPASSTEARAAWRRLHESAGDAAVVQPVLVDEQGHPHYPTGEISVRFREPPSEDALRTFAAAHGLTLRSRNQYVPQQAVFRLADPRRTYLPDLVEKLASDKGVVAAWANTLSSYRRI